MYSNLIRRNRNELVYDPFREFDQLTRRFFGESPALQFGTDIVDDGESYRLMADLPGFKREDIHVDVEGDRLCISAERKQESGSNSDGFLRQERSYGSYSRCFDLSGIQAEDITGSYTDGVLTLVLPKRSQAQTGRRRIELN